MYAGKHTLGAGAKSAADLDASRRVVFMVCCLRTLLSFAFLALLAPGNNAYEYFCHDSGRWQTNKFRPRVRNVSSLLQSIPGRLVAGVSFVAAS